MSTDSQTRRKDESELFECELMWYKAEASAAGDCVEVALDGGNVVVRDSKHPDGSVLTFTATEWDCFLAGVRNDEFDRPRLAARARVWVRRLRRSEHEPALV